MCATCGSNCDTTLTNVKTPSWWDPWNAANLQEDVSCISCVESQMLVRLVLWVVLTEVSRAVFLNCREASRYRTLAAIIPGHERFSWNLSFCFSKQFSWINVLQWKYSEEKNIRECVEKLRPRCWPEETTIFYEISLVQWLITNLNVILYLSTCHTVYISVLILFMIMP